MIRTLILAIAIAVPAAAAAMPPAGTYTYSVKHPDHGDVGTYTNTIRAGDGGTTVDTRLEVSVGIGPLTLYREEADRQERWRDGRLVGYRSRTVKNGEDRVVEGYADGDAFVVKRGEGTVERAPADIWPMNPWSPDIAQADTVLASASGKIYPARVVNAGVETVTSAGRSVSARRYTVTADGKTYNVWFDGDDRLARFTAPGKDGVITFTLTGVR